MKHVISVYKYICDLVRQQKNDVKSIKNTNRLKTQTEGIKSFCFNSPTFPSIPPTHLCHCQIDFNAASNDFCVCVLCWFWCWRWCRQHFLYYHHKRRRTAPPSVPPPTPHPLTLDMSSPYFAMAITCSCSNIYRRLVWIAPCKDVNHILIQIHGKSLQHGYLNAQPYVEFRTT